MWEDAKRLGSSLVWHSLDTPRTSCETGFGRVFLANAGPLKFKVFVGLHHLAGLLAMPDPGGYLGEVMEFLFCIDKIFIFCLQSVITLLKCLSFAWDLSFPSAVF